MIRRPAVWCGVCLVIAPIPCGAQQSIDSLIRDRMEKLHIPGLAIAVVDSGRVAWTGTYGFANAATRTKVTDSTPFQLASVSKPVTATILMTLYAAGKFGLDDDVNRYLPFRVRHPAFPDSVITIRQLLIHRSGIADNMLYYGPYWSKGNGDVTIPLATYLREYFTPESKIYSREKNFLKTAPGERSQYCNTCYALLGYLAERIAGRPFEQLSREALFGPLGMRETAWFARDLGHNPPAAPHRYKADSGFVTLEQNGFPDWPAGTLRSSLRDMSRFLVAYVNGGMLDGKTVIPPTVTRTMAPDDFHLGFLTWFLDGTRTHDILYGHEGGDTGVRTYLAFTHRGKRGVVVLTNGEAGVKELAQEVLIRIREPATKASGN